MNGSAWARATWLSISSLLIFLFLIAGNLSSIVAQSAPDQANSRKPASPSDQASKPAPQARAKPAMSLRERSWEILHAGLEIDNTDKRVKAVTALGLMRGNAEAEKLAIAALKDEKCDVRAAAATALGAMHAVRAK